MLLVCIVAPTAARADDGGFWDMIWYWDVKLMGLGTDFHLLCFDDSGRRVRCENLFTGIGHNPFSTDSLEHPHIPVTFAQIKHQVDFRPAVYWSYGDRIPSDQQTPADATTGLISKRVAALRLTGFYYYSINRVVEVGVGGGAFSVFRLQNGVVWRPVGTISLTTGLGGAWFARFEENYFGNTLTAADLGATNPSYSAKPEWAPSVSIGIDFRRRFH